MNHMPRDIMSRGGAALKAKTAPTYSLILPPIFRQLSRRLFRKCKERRGLHAMRCHADVVTCCSECGTCGAICDMILFVT